MEILAPLAVNVDSNLYVLTAFGAGVISFLSPCVLPIVPGYLSLVTGLSSAELRDESRHYLKHIALYTGLFVAGFTAVFVALSLITTSVSSTILRNEETLTRVSGGIMILLALYLAGSQLLTTPALYREFRLHPKVERFGPFAAPLTGAAFGLAWTPCIGPVLGAILGVAASGQSLTRAAVLMVSYSLGLGLSFLAVGLLMGKLTRTLDWCKRHALAITLASAAVMFLFGVILLTDNLTRVTADFTNAMRDLGLDWLVELG